MDAVDDAGLAEGDWIFAAGRNERKPGLTSSRRSALRTRRRPGFGLRRALGLARDRGLADHLDKRPQGLWHAFAGGARDQQRRLLCGAVQPVFLFLELVGFDRVDLVEGYDFDLVGQMSFIGIEFSPHRLVGLSRM